MNILHNELFLQWAPNFYGPNVSPNLWLTCNYIKIGHMFLNYIGIRRLFELEVVTDLACRKFYDDFVGHRK